MYDVNTVYVYMYLTFMIVIIDLFPWLQLPDPVPLILYANGIMLFSGPFRPFTDPVTQQCVQDITDGYFPSELQNKFPDGVPFVVSGSK